MKMKHILLLAMGGTIASEITEEGLAPEMTSEQILHYVPDVKNLCTVDAETLFSIDSTNILPFHWLAVTKAIRENYDRYDGFVISHGTDTMAYTAAALSYLIQGANKPIILTGAQKPIHFENTDSKINLTDAFRCAVSDTIRGVHIVFNGQVILGTRARKTRSKDFRAFSSVNYPIMAAIRDGYLMDFIERPVFKESVFYDRLNEKVGLVKLIPGMDLEIFELYLKKHDALIVESFGVGGMPDYYDNGFFKLIQKYAERGKFIVMTTQVPNEGSDLGVYHVGHTLKGQANVFEAYDMTTECVVAKLMWILGQTRDSKEVVRRFYTPVARDILIKPKL